MTISKIDKLSRDELVAIAHNAKSYSDILRKIGLSTRGGHNNNHLKERLRRESIPTPNIFIKNGVNRVCKDSLIPKKPRLPLSDVMTLDSTYSRKNLKKRLISSGIMKYECSICSISSWNGMKLILVLDHINGIYNDNRVENLRLLCPNCNSQQDTFAGKNKRNSRQAEVKPTELQIL